MPRCGVFVVQESIFNVKIIEYKPFLNTILACFALIDFKSVKTMLLSVALPNEAPSIFIVLNLKYFYLF